MATCAHTSIFLWISQVSTLFNSLLCHFTLIFISIMITSFLFCNWYTKLNISSYFLYVCMKLCLHICYLHHFLYLFICHLLICYILFFPFLLLHFFLENLGEMIHMNYIHIHDLLLCHILSTHVIVQIFCSCIRYFLCFSTHFHAFIIMSICTHSHDNTKHWWHSSISINRYMLTSTKINFWEVCVVMMKLMWVWYHNNIMFI